MPLSAEHTEHTLPPGYRFSRLDNFQQLSDLFSAVSRNEIPPSYFEKKYATGWTGVSSHGLLVIEPGGRPAAFIGATPAFVEYEGKKELWAQVTDIITHPDHRRLGLFHALVPAFVQSSREAGIRMLYGFPNENSHRILADDFGWTLIGQLNRFEIPLRPNWWSRIKRKMSSKEKGIEKITLHYKTNDPGVATSWNSEGFGGILRDADYFNYKKYNGGFVVKAGAGLAWMNLNRGCWLGELQVKTEPELKESLQHLKSIASGWGEKQLLFHVSTGTNLHTWMGKLYQPLSSFPVLGYSLGGSIPPEKIKFSLADIDIF